MIRLVRRHASLIKLSDRERALAERAASLRELRLAELARVALVESARRIIRRAEREQQPAA